MSAERAFVERHCRWRGEQKRASWFQRRQLRFSMRLPCSMIPEHLEKTAGLSVLSGAESERGRD